jgi:hypothetical protein
MGDIVISDQPLSIPNLLTFDLSVIGEEEWMVLGRWRSATEDQRDYEENKEETE